MIIGLFLIKSNKNKIENDPRRFESKTQVTITQRIEPYASRDVDNSIKMAIMENKRSCAPLALLCIYFICYSVQTVRSSTVDSFQISDENLDANINVQSVRSKRSTDVTDIEGDDEQVCKLQLMEFKEAREKLTKGERLEETVSEWSYH